jgi:hypothetical protein
MKRSLLLAFIFLSCYSVEPEKPRVAEPEKPRFEIAVVQISRVTNDIEYDKIRLLNLDKDTIDAIKKINLESASLKKEIIEVKDEIKLMEIQKQLDFNSKKLSILRDRNSSGREVNIQKIATDFIVKKFSGRYAMILQDTNGIEGRVMYKNIKVVDITEEASELFKKDFAEKTGDKVEGASNF